MKNKKIIIGLLIMLSLLVSGFTYAYWSNINLNGTGDTSGSVTIGEGRQASVTVDLFSALPVDSTLVPEDEAGNSVSLNPVEEIVFVFYVDYVDNMFEGEDAQITLAVINVSNATAAGLLNFTFTGGNIQTITEGEQLTVTLTVTLTAPANETEYNAIINDIITFDITFIVDPNA
jgi:hypothetical protein